MGLNMPIYYIPKTQFKIVTAKEMQSFIDATPLPEMKVVLALAWITGARIQEILNLVPDDFKLNEASRDGMVIVRALKFGKIGYPSFSFSDPFVSDVISTLYLAKGGGGSRLFSYSKRYYQKKLHDLNLTLYPNDTSKWVTFHYLRHSRLTHLAQVLRAFPEELKSWTGHRSSAFEEYFAPRRIDRFKGKLGDI